MGVSAASLQAGAKSAQRGQIWATGGTGGTAPEVRYMDITISAVNTSKARVNVVGLLVARSLQADADNLARTADLNTPTANEKGMLFGYLLNSTTVRVYGGVSNTAWRWAGRWEVLEDY